MILFIDTSQNNIALKLIQSHKIVDSLDALESSHHSEQILKLIDKILKANSKSIDDLIGIIVVRGIGGYTGLRVGISTANAIAFSKNIPIVGIENPTNDKKIINSSLLLQKKLKFLNSVFPQYPYPPKITKKN